MTKINLLGQDLVNKIAAGEVIERPSSIVKELIENSIDANADIINIEVWEGGKSTIIVSDNGIGMDKEDALLSIKRHTTSKIKEQGDLFNISTLGFRGEALASISAVSKLKMKTKTENSIEGAYLEVENSEIKEFKLIGCDIGTTIEVGSLFYNIPARKKYLGSVSFEFSKILNIVTRYAVINTNISFSLYHNDRKVLFAPKSKSLLDKIANIYGKEIAKEMIPIDYSSQLFCLDGFISKPTLTRNSKDMQSIYVNKRYVRSKEIMDYVYESYHTLLHSDRNPIIILDFRILPRFIDVNVHPTKDIVKIENLFRIRDGIITTLKLALSQYQDVQRVELKNVDAKPVHSYELKKDKQLSLVLKEQSELFIPKNALKIDDRVDGIAPFIVIGQINKTYILAENSQGLMIADQHAAQERINYERLMRELKHGGIKTQALIKPRVVEISSQEAMILSENLSLLKKIGFTIEDFGNNSFLIRSVPMIFGRFEKELITDIIRELSEIDVNVIAEVKEKRIITMACRGSIKAGEELTVPYMTQLINELSITEQPFTCPHGRPTIINVTIAELERKFKRVC